MGGDCGVFSGMSIDNRKYRRADSRAERLRCSRLPGGYSGRPGQYRWYDHCGCIDWSYGRAGRWIPARSDRFERTRACPSVHCIDCDFVGAPAGVDGQQAGGEVVNVQIIKQFKIHEQGPLWEVFGSGTQRCIGPKMVWDTLQEAVSVVLKGLPGSLQSVRQFRSPSDLQQSLSATSQIRTAQNVPSAITDN